MGAHSARRPAPTGVVYNAFDRAVLTSATEFLNLPQTGATAINAVTLDGFNAAGALVARQVPLALADPAPPPGTNNWEGSSPTTMEHDAL